MSTVFNRVTLERRDGVPADSYAPAQWLVDPDLSGIVGVPDEYWKVVGDTVVEMAAAEKAAVDAQQLGVAKKEKLYEFEVAVDEYTAAHYDQAGQRMLLALLDETRRLPAPLVNREAYIQGALNWVKMVVGYYCQQGGAVMAQATIAGVQAVVLNLAQFDAADPHVHVPGALSIAT